MKQRLLAIFYFYLSIAIFGGVISLFTWWALQMPVDEDFHVFLPLYLLMKIYSDAMIWWYLRKQNAARLFFYSNLGISELRLYLSVFAIDIIAFLLLVLLVKLILF